MITIDGSMGEGGGQILRSALALSMLTGRPFRMINVRAGRKKPGLMRQHLTAIRAASEVSHAEVEGAGIGGRELVFRPGPVQGGNFHFAIGTAGSTTLVLQAILPALLLAREPSTIVLEGGTHNSFAPPFDFLGRSFLPIISRLGPKVELILERAGFCPAGGGRMTAKITPSRHWIPLELVQRGDLLGHTVRVLLADLPEHIAEREINALQDKLNWPTDSFQIEKISHSRGPGNVILIETAYSNLTVVFTAFGIHGVQAEAIASEALDEYRDYVRVSAPVDKHLADQLVIPLALAGGRYRTASLSRHTTTNLEVVRLFWPESVAVHPVDEGMPEITVEKPQFGACLAV